MAKIAHITTVDISLRYLLLNQMQAIKEYDHEVVGVSSPGDNSTIIIQHGIRHETVHITRKFSPFTDLVSLWRLYRLMKAERFTIVHTHTPKPGLIGQLAARMAGIPIVINTLHGFYFHDNMPAQRRNFYVTMERIAALCSDIILSQNSEDIETAIREKICSPKQIKFLGNGVNLAKFNPKTINKAQLTKLRAEFGIENSCQVVGFVGRLVAEKGILELLTAAKIILKKVPLVKFLLIGPLDQEKADAINPNIVASHGLGEQFVFTGMRQDMPDMYALMNVFTLPSHREGFPRSAMEASAMGIPSVLTNIRGCREVVKHGHNGLLVPYKQPESLAQAILELLLNPEKSQRMGQAGIRIAQQKFDERHVFQIVLEEYNQLLKEMGLCESIPNSN